MDKKRIIGIILGVVLVLLVGLKFYLNYQDNQKKEEPQTEERKPTADSKAFKEQYESLNGTKNSSDKDYLTVSIAENNPVTIKTDEEILDVLNNGTGVIYFGFNSCPWCRSLVETLLQSIDDNNINNLYYVDIKDIRSTYEVKNKKLKETKKGTESYYEILEKLDEYLTEYTITENKKEYDTKEKRLYAPTVVAIKNGEIVGFHEGTVDSMEDPYLGLTSSEKKELSKIFTDIFKDLKDNTCKDERGC